LAIARGLRHFIQPGFYNAIQSDSLSSDESDFEVFLEKELHSMEDSEGLIEI